MTSLTYPVPGIEAPSDLSPEQIHQLLQSQPAVARRVRSLASQRFIADALLKGRYQTVGGAVLYENGEPIFAEGGPEAVQPGGNYPRGQVNEGDLASALVDKWGKDYPITDESIKRRGIAALNKVMNKGVNTMVRFVDQAALGVISSKITQTHESEPWSDVDAIIDSITMAKAEGEESGEGHVYDTIVLKPTSYARVMGAFVKAGVLPRESANPLLSGTWPEVLDLTWLRSPHVPTNAPLILDTEELGGMADENLGGPGYTGALNGVEVKTIRDEHRDGYDFRTRRVTVPVVDDPTAGVAIVGTGL